MRYVAKRNSERKGKAPFLAALAAVRVISSLFNEQKVWSVIQNGFFFGLLEKTGHNVYSLSAYIFHNVRLTHAALCIEALGVLAVTSCADMNAKHANERR